MRLVLSLAVAAASIVAEAAHAQTPVPMSDEQIMAAGADGVIDQVKAIGAFCRENAQELNYDFEGIAGKFSRFRQREFGNVAFTEDMQRLVQAQREQNLKDLQSKVLSMVKEQNAARAFCNAAYAKWINMDQQQFSDITRRSYQEYKSRVDERRKKNP